MKNNISISYTKTFLFTWNPFKWKWDALDANIELFENGGTVTERWSCVSYKRIKPGDRAFLVRLGSEPRGIFASGTIGSNPYLSKHWSGEDKESYRVQINFDHLLHPEKDPILTLDVLNRSGLQNQQWTPQSSGISIKPGIAQELETLWFEFLSKNEVGQNSFIPSESEMERLYSEGLECEIVQTRYERNKEARKRCLEHYGYSCSVCDFNFEKRFGDMGKKFIHVHHLTQISSVGKNYQVSPIKDLRPVCPNCHAMLHKQNPPFTIEELKQLMV